MSRDPQHNRADLVFNMSCCPWLQLYRMLDSAMQGAGYQTEDVEAAIREKVDRPLFEDGRIVKLAAFPPDTSPIVRERVIQIHGEVCRAWGCDPSWDWDPKA